MAKKFFGMHQYGEDVKEDILAAIPTYLDSQAPQDVEEFKKYAVATGAAPVGFTWTPDIDTEIRQAFFSKVNSQEPLEDEPEEEETLYAAGDVVPGDILDMGPYGEIIFVEGYDQERFWGTSNTEEYLNKGSQASGWYCHYVDIQDIRGNVNESEDEDFDSDTSDFLEGTYKEDVSGVKKNITPENAAKFAQGMKDQGSSIKDVIYSLKNHFNGGDDPLVQAAAYHIYYPNAGLFERKIKEVAFSGNGTNLGDSPNMAGSVANKPVFSSSNIKTGKETALKTLMGAQDADFSKMSDDELDQAIAQISSATAQNDSFSHKI